MTTTPLPPLPEPAHSRLAPDYTADQMQAYANQARADLEAEVARLREALTEIKSIADLAERGSERIALGQARQAARAALEKQHD